MKRISASLLLLIATGSSTVYAAPASGEAAGSAATTLAEGNSNVMGLGGVAALLGVALATMGGGGDGDASTTTTSTSTTTSTQH
ncbi:exopolysaccharide production protein YjbE [Erwinia mallotivora]|uniref:exopolysaccharide production protein YjbE n=1 Tax=Erwinia mallotivora TaxID=69222 RepID=UPI0035E5A985